MLGAGEVPCIILIVALTLFYTFEGGMTAVIWTDVIQSSLMIAAAFVAVGTICGLGTQGYDLALAFALVRAAEETGG